MNGIARDAERRRQEPEAGLLGEAGKPSLATVVATVRVERSEMRLWSILGNSQQLDGRGGAPARCHEWHRARRRAPEAGAGGRVAWRGREAELSNRRRHCSSREV